MPTAYIISKNSNRIELQFRFEDEESGLISDGVEELVPGREFEGWTFNDILNYEDEEGEGALPVPKPD